jgi:hypothetical protein
MAEYGHVVRYEAQPDGPSSLGRRGYGNCTFCQSPDTVWQHDLNASLSSFRTMYGKGTIWGNSHKLCDRCEQLYNAGEYAALARLQTGDPPSHEDELADHLIALAAFCRADRGPRELELPSFPPGFEPWEEYTGAEFVFGIWPEHRRAVVDGVELDSSPWPSVDLNTVFRVVWSWAERDRSLDVAVARAAAAEALQWPESRALAWLAEQD